MAIAAYSPNQRFTTRLLELGIIPKNCAEWQLIGKPGDILAAGNSRIGPLSIPRHLHP